MLVRIWRAGLDILVTISYIMGAARSAAERMVANETGNLGKGWRGEAGDPRRGERRRAMA